MSDSGKIFNPTDPGPFQKYLFSGACYIKIGQCYSLIKQAIEQGQVLTDNGELEEQLIKLWTDYLLQQTVMAKGPWPTSSQADEIGLASTLNNLDAVIRQAGSDAVKELIGQLNKMEAGKHDLNSFFIHWASVCDKAYARMVRTEVFSLALGATINHLLQYSVMHSRSRAQ